MLVPVLAENLKERIPWSRLELEGGDVEWRWKLTFYSIVLGVV